jgi:hypothetical protein
MLRNTFVLMSGVLLWIAAPSVLAVPDDQAAARMRFQAMDRNADGEIARAEWQGSPRSFAVHDWNGDGKLSGDEVRIGAQRATDWNTVDHNPSISERIISYSRAGFQTLDHNRDNRLTANEWHHDVETFRRIDANRDNALTEAEFLGTDTDVDDLRGDRFDDIDVNNDGRVNRNEWYGSAAAFDRFDQNRDGVLSRFEVVGGENYSDDGLDQFRNLDYDNNGVLARDEWHWSPLSFNARDLNRDGTISRQEFASVGAPGAAGAAVARNTVAAPRTVRVNAKQRWTDTGVDAQAGDVITFNSTGTIGMGGPDDNATPAGSTTGRKAPEAPLLNQPAGVLIARVGAFSPIFVGGRRQVTAPVSGRVYLGVNDDYLGDNSGEFIVAVGVTR